MANNTSRLRLLYLQQLFSNSTDEEHSYTMPELQKYLMTLGIQADRRAIYEDIEALNHMDMDIQRQPTGKRGYFLASRLFDSPEIGIIADTLRSSRYLSEQKTDRLLSKLRKLTPPMRRRENVCSRFYDLRKIGGNSTVLYLLDNLNDAVQDKENCTVEFYYFRLDYHKHREMQNGGRPIRGRPEMLLWKDGIYYLIIRDREMKFSLYPVEQIVDLKRLPPFPKLSGYLDYKLSLHAESVIGLATGHPQKVTLRCVKPAAHDLFQQFGTDVSVYAVDTQSFKTDVHVIPGPDFFAWLLKQGGRMQILEPKEVRDAYVDMLREQIDLYSN